MSILDQVTKGFQDYFSQPDSPVSKITSEIDKIKTATSSDVIAKATTSTLNKIQTAVTAPPPDAKKQADGTFIVPNDPAKTGMSWPMIAGIGAGVFVLALALRR